MEAEFSILKAQEGGMGQREAIRRLKAAGIKALPDYSPYVGHTGIRVIGNARQLRRAERIVFSRV